MNLIEILLDIYPEVGFLEHSVVLFLTSGGNTILFSIVAVPINIPTNSVGGFHFLHIQERSILNG